MFSDRLRALRRERKISQVSLAETLGISQQAVGKWETGRSTPDPRTLRRLADIFDVTTDYLLGREDELHPAAPWPFVNEAQVPVIGTVKAGYGALAFQEDYGTEPANVKNPDNYFYLIVTGDSMEPRIRSGDLALVHKQPDVQSGELAVVLVDGEEGTLKKVIKKDGAVILQPFNQAYQTQIYMGEELSRIQIVGKVVETKTKW
ncbi:XRE family transcriptional regulator [Anaerotruncus sp. AF02-27]|jgi:repressor LexA|uniref:LexA family protein n=1 Tax=Anaerotruncus TaxID=244127 RepID=UPI000E4A427D|nr:MULTISPECIES: XRE family transcriptional regulator [Anaerotruncus]RGX54594.1 XRE family transcriptional regulator [Anaerotruncus sp. AF02-27]